MLQLNGFWRDKTLQILLVPENDGFRVEREILGVDVEVSFYVNGGRKKLRPAFFDGFEMVLLYLRELRDLLQRDVSRLPFLS